MRYAAEQVGWMGAAWWLSCSLVRG